MNGNLTMEKFLEMMGIKVQPYQKSILKHFDMLKQESYEFGEDPEIQRIRNKIPEPINYNHNIYRAYVSKHRPINTELIHVPDWLSPNVRILNFEKRLIQSGGCLFYCWVCKEDGMMYI